MGDVKVLDFGNLTEAFEPAVDLEAFFFEGLFPFADNVNGYIRSTWIPKSDLGSAASSLIIYRKLHKKQP